MRRGFDRPTAFHHAACDPFVHARAGFTSSTSSGLILYSHRRRVISIVGFATANEVEPSTVMRITKYRTMRRTLQTGFKIHYYPMATHPIILPGATLGVLGSGQLGRMFAISARQMGYRVATFSPDDDTPTGQVADSETNASYDDLDAVRAFAQSVSVVTFEFENVPATTAAAAAEYAPVRPGGDVLHTTQHRLREKTFLRDNGFPVTPFHAVSSLEELRLAIHRVGCPAVLKTAGWGYDGKGQVIIKSPDHADTAWAGLESTEAVLEAFVDFEKEVSLVAARGIDGSFVHWDLIENDHHHHILDTSICPAIASPATLQQAVEIARGILDQLQVVGVLCVEFFLPRG